MDKNRLINTFFNLVKINSETGNEKPVADYLVPILENLGFDITFDDAGKHIKSNCNNLIAKRGDTKNEDAIILSCHMDTVKPGIGIEPIINEDNYIVSAGDTILGSDDKAGITAIIEALRYLKEENIETKPLEIVFTISEEGGLHGSRLLDYNLLNAKRAFVLDSGSDVGKIIIKAPGQDRINVLVKGRAAHAGTSPESGISAIQIASRAINNMKLLKIDEDTTANIGTIQGGLATNIVCPEVAIKAEARSKVESKLIAQTEHMVNCFKEAADYYLSDVEIVVERAYDPFSLDENDKVPQMAKAALEKIGLKAIFGSTGGGSDTNNYNKNGIEAVNMGSGIEKAHTLDERIKIENLVNLTKFVVALVEK